MTKIAYLLTTTPYDDRRQYIRQAPSLRAAGDDVHYIAGLPEGAHELQLNELHLSARQRSWSRKTGALNLYGLVKSLHPEIIQLCSIEQLPLGILLKLTSKIKVIYDCREDMAPSLLNHRDGIPKPVRMVLYYMVLALEFLAAKLFDGIVTADPFVYDKHKGMPVKRKMVFYNAAQLRDFKDDYLPLPQRKHDLVVMGSMSSRTGVLDVLAAVGLLKNGGKTVSLLLLGEPDKAVMGMINEKLERYDIREQVTITGKMPHLEVPEVLSSCKIGIVPLHDHEKFRNNIACKALEYMACGMPCICSDLRPQRLFMSEPDNGYFYEAGNIYALKEKIETLLDSEQGMETVGKRNRALVENSWNAEKFEAEYAEFYKTLSDLPLRTPFASR